MSVQVPPVFSTNGLAEIRRLHSAFSISENGNSSSAILDNRAGALSMYTLLLAHTKQHKTHRIGHNPAVLSPLKWIVIPPLSPRMLLA